MLCVLLQQVSVDYRTRLSGLEISGSLIHLHTGLLFVIAMLARDRRIFTVVTVVAALAWIAPRFLQTHDYAMLAWSSGVWMLAWAWTLLCAHLAGWPRASGDSRFHRRDLLPFAFYGLLLFPFGSALLSSSVIVLTNPALAVNAAFQAFFAKQFGVAVLALPVVIAWGERGRRGWQRPLRRRDIAVFLLLLLGLAFSLWMTLRIRGGLGAPGPGPGPGVVMMDYRFVLLAVLLWCVLRLPTTVAMAALSLALFALVHATAGAASRSDTPLGFLNLVHVTLETSVLLMTMCYLWVVSRDRRELSRRLVEETRRDTVTGLPNLKALRERASSRTELRPELGYLLLDQTDTLLGGAGLETQAAAMRTVAARLKNLVRLYYVGTGQFALLPRPRAGDDVWDQVVARVEQTEIDAGGQAMRLLPYLGVATLPDHAAPVDTALLAASLLAHEARQFGEIRPRYSEVGDMAARDERHRQLHEAAEALACLRSQRVELYFQPIRHVDDADAADGGITGEVLCRLRSESGNELLPPSRFITAVEQSGRGAELDLAVLHALFRLLRRYPRALAHCRQLGINLTGQSLASTSFQIELRTLLADSPLPLSALCFEITETAAISSTSAASELLADLRAKGCRIAIDDFGVGMQSFARLKELPVDIIKIDGSFIRNVTQRGRDHALVQASVAVAEAFGAETVAEFVENQEIADCLRGMGVQWLQGYLYSPPVPLAQVLAEAGLVKEPR